MGWFIKNPIFSWSLTPFLLEAVEYRDVTFNQNKGSLVKRPLLRIPNPLSNQIYLAYFYPPEPDTIYQFLIADPVWLPMESNFLALGVTEIGRKNHYVPWIFEFKYHEAVKFSLQFSQLLYRGSPDSTNFGPPGDRTIAKIVLSGDWFSTKIAIWDF